MPGEDVKGLMVLLNEAWLSTSDKPWWSISLPERVLPFSRLESFKVLFLFFCPLHELSDAKIRIAY